MEDSTEINAVDVAAVLSVMRKNRQSRSVFLTCNHKAVKLTRTDLICNRLIVESPVLKPPLVIPFAFVDALLHILTTAIIICFSVYHVISGKAIKS